VSELPEKIFTIHHIKLFNFIDLLVFKGGAIATGKQQNKCFSFPHKSQDIKQHFFFTLENNKGAVAVEGKFEFNSKFFRQMGFTKHYRAADGGQPAVIRERNECSFFSFYESCICKQVNRIKRYSLIFLLLAKISEADHDLLSHQ
jgi:hypothetical protein